MAHLKTKLSQNGCSVESKNIGAGGGRFSYDPVRRREDVFKKARRANAETMK